MQDACLTVITGTPILATIFVCLRLYARKRVATLAAGFGWSKGLPLQKKPDRSWLTRIVFYEDDYAIMLAAVCCVRKCAI